MAKDSVVVVKQGSERPPVRADEQRRWEASTSGRGRAVRVDETKGGKR
jgi:hypothetical protein